MSRYTRGQAWDLIVAQAQEDEKYYAKLLADPREVMQQEGVAIPHNMKITVLEESPHERIFVIPYFQREGAELSDGDLEAVAGGANVKGNANCTSTGVALGTTVVEVDF